MTMINPTDDYAVMSLRRWREAGHGDDAILAFCRPHPADAEWEAAQLATPGHVYAPPAVVKARIRQLLTH
jgi:hypothetical protein